MAGRIDLNVIRITQTIAKLSDRVVAKIQNTFMAVFGTPALATA